MTVRQSVDLGLVLALFIGVSAVSIIGMTIPFFVLRPITELQILLLLYGVSILIHAASYEKDSVGIPVGFIAVIIGSVAIDRRSEWVMLYKQHRVLTGFLGSITMITFVLTLGVVLKDGHDLLKNKNVALPAMK